MGTDGIDSGASSGASFENYTSGVGGQQGADVKKFVGENQEAADLLQAFFGGEGGQTTTQVKGSEAFQDELSSAKQGTSASTDGDVAADAALSTGTGGSQLDTAAITDGKVTAAPGTPEFRDQTITFAQENIKANLGIFSTRPGATPAAMATLTNDQLANLSSFFPPQSPEDKAIHGDQNTLGTDANLKSSVLTVMSMADAADGIQGKIGSDAFRALLKDPSAENLSHYPQLSEQEKGLVQNSTFAAVINGFDTAIDRTTSAIASNPEFSAMLSRADSKHPELSAPKADHTGAAKFSDNLTPPDGNPFFAVCLTAVLAVFFAELAETQTKQMMMESKNVIAGMERTGSLYASAADMIKQSAMAQATMYMVQAVMSAVQFVGAAYTLGGMMKSRSQAETQINNELNTLKEKQVDADASLGKVEGRPGIQDKVLRREELSKKDIDKMDNTEKSDYDKLKTDDDLKDLDRAKSEKTKADYELLDANQNKIKKIDDRAGQIFWERQVMGQLIDSGAKTIENAVNAAITVLKGQLDAALKLNEGATKINEQYTQSASKAMADSKDAFKAIMDAKERSMGALMKSFTIGTRG